MIDTRRAACAAVLFVVAGTAGAAREPTADPVPLPDEASIKAELGKVPEIEGLEQADRDRLTTLLDEMLVERGELNRQSARADDFERQRAGTAARVTALEREERSFTKPPPPIGPEETPIAIQNLLGDARKDLATAEGERDRWFAELDRRAERRVSIGKRLPELRELRDSVSKRLAMPPPGQPPRVAKVFDLLQRVRLARVDAELKAIEAEQAFYDSTTELVKREREVAPNRVEFLRQRVAALDEALRIGQEREAAALREQARARAVAAANAHPAVADLARRNAELGTVLENQRQLLADCKSSAEGLLSKMTATRERIVASRKDVESKLEVPGMAATIGRELVRERMTLPRPGDLRHEIRRRQAEVNRYRVEVTSYRQQLNEVRDLAPVVEEFLAELRPPLPESERDEVGEFTRQLFEARRTMLDGINGDYTEAIDALTRLNEETQATAAAAGSYADYLADHSRWIPNAGPLSLNDWTRTVDGLAWLVSPGRWMGVASDLGRAVRNTPVISTVTLIVVICLTVLRERLRRRLSTIGDRASRSYTASYKLTAEALCATVAVASVFPLLVFFIGWRLGASLESADFSRSVGAGLFYTGIVYATLEFVRQLLRHNGLAEAHFHWRRQRISRPRNNLRWLTLLGLPAMFVVGLVEWDRDIDRWETLGRLALILELLLIAVFAALVFRPLGFEHESAAETKTSTWERALHLAAAGAPIVLAGLVFMGYQIAVARLFLQLLETVWLVLAVAIAQGMTVRWLYYSRGRLALEQARQRREAEAAAQPEADGDEAALAAPEEPTIDLATVNAHTRSILRTCVTLSVVIGFWLIWFDELPSFGVLDHGLWTTEQKVTTVVEMEGVGVPRTVTELVPVTVGDVAFAIVVLIVALNAARNVPGLLEVLVLQYLPFDAGARYATTTLVKYVLTAGGILLSLALVGIGWDTLGYVAAGLSVGLGFGLQEIVANFVCGLILLFERPIRVGDIVTIGGVDGVVTKIHIRATTVRNWDRKEYVVPNKELITGTLMNWTLTDKINRVVIVIGVAYGTDTERVRSLLFAILADHPEVMKDPAPLVTFENFGDSTLDFVVRCYLPNLDNRMETTHQLYTTIHHRFNEAGIEIAFPQRDLHLRTAPPLEQVLGGGNDHVTGNGSLVGTQRVAETE